MTYIQVRAVPYSYKDENEVVRADICVVTNHQFGASDGSDTIDFNSQQSGLRIQAVAAAFVDNSQNASAVQIVTQIPANALTVAARSQGLYPVFTSSLQQITVVNVSGAQVGITNITWLESPASLNAWQTGFNGAIVTVQDAVVEQAIRTVGGQNTTLRTTLNVNGNDSQLSNPQPVQLSNGSTAIVAATPLAVQLSQTNAILSSTNPLFATLSVNGGLVTNANAFPVNIENVPGVTIQGNAAASPVAVQLSQTNAVVSASNPIPVGISDSGVVVSTTNPLHITQANTVGAFKAKVLSAATTNANSVKNVQGNLFGYDISNNAAIVVYLHFYDKASVPNVGTDVPVFTVMLGANIKTFAEFTVGLRFTNGIAYSITTNSPDTDNTALAVAGNIFGVLSYY